MWDFLRCIFSSWTSESNRRIDSRWETIEIRKRESKTNSKEILCYDGLWTFLRRRFKRLWRIELFRYSIDCIHYLIYWIIEWVIEWLIDWLLVGWLNDELLNYCIIGLLIYYLNINSFLIELYVQFFLLFIINYFFYQSR